MVRRFAFLLTVLAVISLAGGTALGAVKSPFKPGVYVGETSQGRPFRLRLTVGGEPCSGKPCLFAPSENAEIYIEEPCEGGAMTNEYLGLFEDPVTKSGTVHANGSGSSQAIATLKVSHHGTLTGNLRASVTFEEGRKCDSGNVTLSAKIK